MEQVHGHNYAEKIAREIPFNINTIMIERALKVLSLAWYLRAQFLSEGNAKVLKDYYYGYFRTTKHCE
jgi:hypothetical protein